MKKNLRHMSALVKHLDDEYEVEQLNPVWATNPKTGKEYSHQDISDEVKKLKENTSLRLRIATMEAIIDQVVEDKIEEDPDATSTEIEAEVEPIVDKAVELALVPSAVKNLIAPAIIRHRRRRDPRMELMAKCAIFMTQTMTRMEEDKVTIDETNSDANEDVQAGIAEEIKDATSPNTEHPSTECPIEAQEKGLKDIPEDEISVESPLPKPAEAAMKQLAASTITSRKATARVIKNIAGAVSAHMFHELRYCLPEKFKEKYGIK